MENNKKLMYERFENNQCIEDVLNMLNDKKSVNDIFAIDGNLVIVFDEELQTSEVDDIQSVLKKVKGCGKVFSDEFELQYQGDYKSILLKLFVDNISVADFSKSEFISMYNKPIGETIFYVYDIDDEYFEEEEEDIFDIENWEVYEFKNIHDAIAKHEDSNLQDLEPIRYTTWFDTNEPPFVYEWGVVTSDGKMKAQTREGRDLPTYAKGGVLKNYPNIDDLKMIYKFEGVWYAWGERYGEEIKGEGKTKKEALEDLDLHLSYVSPKKEYAKGGELKDDGANDIKKEIGVLEEKRAKWIGQSEAKSVLTSPYDSKIDNLQKELELIRENAIEKYNVKSIKGMDENAQKKMAFQFYLLLQKTKSLSKFISSLTTPLRKKTWEKLQYKSYRNKWGYKVISNKIADTIRMEMIYAKGGEMEDYYDGQGDEGYANTFEELRSQIVLGVMEDLRIPRETAEKVVNEKKEMLTDLIENHGQTNIYSLVQKAQEEDDSYARHMETRKRLRNDEDTYPKGFNEFAKGGEVQKKFVTEKELKKGYKKSFNLGYSLPKGSIDIYGSLLRPIKYNTYYIMPNRDLYKEVSEDKFVLLGKERDIFWQTEVDKIQKRIDENKISREFSPNYLQEKLADAIKQKSGLYIISDYIRPYDRKYQRESELTQAINNFDKFFKQAFYNNKKISYSAFLKSLDSPILKETWEKLEDYEFRTSKGFRIIIDKKKDTVKMIKIAVLNEMKRRIPFLYKKYLKLEEGGDIDAFAKGGDISQGDMYSIELDTNNIEDEDFQKYLKSNSISYKVISRAKGTSYSQDDSIKYVGKKEALMSMIDDYFAGTQQDSIEAYKEIKKMAKGGEVKKISTTTQVKRNLRGSGAFTLELEMAVYVPSTTVADQIISKTLFQKRIQEVEKYLSKLFGGYSSTAIDGGYVSKEKGLIKEDAAKVTAFGTEDAIRKNFKPLMRQISKWCESWGQESMGFEFEGDLYYVSKDAKFSKGGKIENKPVKPKFVKNAKK